MKRSNSVEAPFDEFGLSAFSIDHDLVVDSASIAGHTHLELEILLIETGLMTLDFAGRRQQVGPGELAAYWGGLPHAVVHASAGTRYHVAQVPIVDVLSWIGTADVFDRLLHGDFLRSPSSTDQTTMDRLAFARWSTDLAARDRRLRTTVELEIQARLQRLLRSQSPEPATKRHAQPATTQVVAAAIRYVVRHFMEHLTIDDIARATARNRDHVMASFRRVCGITLWEYVTRVRLGEAQRLLSATDLPVLTICHRAGFSSTSRMYDAFQRHCGQTPAQYRRQPAEPTTHAAAERRVSSSLS